MKECRLSREAVVEVAEAAAWYGARQSRLDTESLNEGERILPLIGAHPESATWALVICPATAALSRPALGTSLRLIVSVAHGLMG